jgi:hydrogenase nickel incorporation protein HypA/HybF
MHEVSLIESVVALVEDEQRKQDFSRVRLIRLRVGALGHAEPDALRFCFDAVTRGTIADGARLEIEMVPGEGKCFDCGRVVQTGDELRLAELEVE